MLRRYAVVSVVVLALLALATPAKAAVTPTNRQCQSLRADRTVATKVAAAPAKGAPLSGDRLENDYIDTAVAADMPLAVTTARRGCR